MTSTSAEQTEAIRQSMQDEKATKDEVIRELVHALRRADQFITNGIEFGFIRMPDAGTPDPAHETPGIIHAALRKAGAL